MSFKLPMAVLAGALSLTLVAPLPALAASSEVTSIVGDTRPSAELSDKELRKRLQTLRTAIDDPNTSDAARKELKSLMRADRTEQESRGGGGGGAAADNGGGDNGGASAPPTNSAAASNDPAADNAGGGSEVATIDSVVSTTKPSSSLSDKALAGRLAEIEAGLGRAELPRPLRRELKTMQDADTAELQRRQQAVAAEQPAVTEQSVGAPDTDAAAANDEAAQDQQTLAPTKKKRGGTSAGDAASAAADDEAAQDQPTLTPTKKRRNGASTGDAASAAADDEATQDEQTLAPAKTKRVAASAGDSTADARQLLLSSRALDRLPERELRSRLNQTRQLLDDRSLPANLRGKLTDLAAKLRAEIRQRGTAAGSAPGADEPVVAEQPPIKRKKEDGATPATLQNATDKLALVYINDTTRVDRLPRPKLRERLEAYRKLLATGQLSPGVEKQLNAKLKRERALLRERVAVEEVQVTESATNRAKSKTPRVVVKVAVPEPTFTEAPKLADDSRRASDLNERQLNRRIMAYRVLNRSDRVSAEDKARYRDRVRADRAELRRRLLDDKKRRVVEVRQEPKIQVNVDLGRNAGVTLWAAEANDDEIERQLVARPVRRLQQRYPRRIILEQPERIIDNEEVRESLPSVEIDTINFGFNESFVAEEEIADLDRIGTILERILSNHPDEVFLIEGHTDAVGSDAYNLRLSLERARAVKAALIDYYAISPDNLTVVGLGERYLKIPTLDEEQENRRVTVRRMTPLMSDYDAD